MNTFGSIRLADADRGFEIKISAYEGDEAATQAIIFKHTGNRPEGYLGLLPPITVGVVWNVCDNVNSRA